jgi:uncharacterized membrane protein SirB2
VALAYDVLKAVHVASAAASLALFALREAWMIGAPHRLKYRSVRIVPHIVDTVLLVSAIGLAVMIGNYPGAHGWLTGKVAGLVAYIVLGSIALKRGPTRCVRVAAFAAALAMFAYIVSVAMTKSPAGFFLWAVSNREAASVELDRIAAGTTELHVPRGEMLFNKGDPCVGFHLVIYGQVKLAFVSREWEHSYRTLQAQARAILATLQMGPYALGAELRDSARP